VRSGLYLQRCVAGALGALLLLYGSSWPTSAADAKPLTAILLIARDELPDSHFADSVVLVMNDLGPAPVGVIIINRPMLATRGGEWGFPMAVVGVRPPIGCSCYTATRRRSRMDSATGSQQVPLHLRPLVQSPRAVSEGHRGPI
jgi:hypothetical protein